MTGGWRRVLAAVAVAGLATGVTPPQAHAADCAGVTVVVDFGSLGGGVRTGCAPGDPASGAAALSGAGFGYTYAARQPGFVCRINGLPADDPCVTTSPPTAHWSYWHAQPGGSWTYSGAGASGRDPAPGGVEGWAFGAGAPPSVPPPAPAPQPQPQPQPQPPAQQPQPQPPAPNPGQPGQTGQTGRPQPTATGRPASSAPAATTSSEAPAGSSAPVSTSVSSPASSPGVAPSSAAPTGTTAVAVEPTAGTSSGGAVGLVAGLAAVAALAGLAWWTARRRAKAAE